MNEYFRTYRLVPFGTAVLITIPMCLGVLGIAREGAQELLAGGPLFLLLSYALVGGYLNRVVVRVDKQGVHSSMGPVPLAPAQALGPHGDIVKVYVRQSSRPTRTRRIAYLGAGVQRTDGCWMDLPEPRLPDAAAWKEAAAIAKALSWPRPVEELWGGPPKPDWGSMRGVWYWCGAILAGIAWGCAVQFWF